MDVFQLLETIQMSYMDAAIDEGNGVTQDCTKPQTIEVIDKSC